MKRVMAIALVFMLMGSVTSVFAQSYSSAASSGEGAIFGEVITLDEGSSVLVVKKVRDADPDNYEVVEVEVVPETEIIQGDIPIEFSDIEVGDNILVKYAKDRRDNVFVEKIIVERF